MLCQTGSGGGLPCHSTVINSGLGPEVQLSLEMMAMWDNESARPTQTGEDLNAWRCSPRICTSCQGLPGMDPHSDRGSQAAAVLDSACQLNLNLIPWSREARGQGLRLPPLFQKVDDYTGRRTIEASLETLPHPRRLPADKFHPLCRHWQGGGARTRPVVSTTNTSTMPRNKAFVMTIHTTKST